MGAARGASGDRDVTRFFSQAALLARRSAPGARAARASGAERRARRTTLLQHRVQTMSTAPKRIRKQYVNSEYPLVIMRFEDGHEIKVYKGTGKEFDAYPGETIKLLAMYDPTSHDRELVDTKKSDDFPDAAE
jgi:hypothetical protein